jgi:HEAT repeat protein
MGGAQAIGPLGEALGDMHSNIRRAAARALCKLGGPEVVEALARGLRDPQDEVRQIAAEGLAGIDDEQSSRALAAALTDGDEKVRILATNALASRPGIAVESSLIAALSGPGRSARQAAAKALTARGWQPGDDRQKAIFLVAMENPLGAAELGESAVDALCIAVLDDGHYYMVQTAAQCLGRLFDTRAVDALCTVLEESTDVQVLAAAATALGQIRDPGALDAVREALAEETDDWVKPCLASALENLEAARQGDRRLLALEDPEPAVQLRAALLLARGRDERGWQWLAGALTGDNTLLRGKAIASLRKMGGPGAIELLVNRIKGGGYDGPNEAIDALTQLGEPGARAMAEALPAMDHNARWATLIGLARMGLSGLVALHAVVPGTDRELKKITCEVLGRIGDREDVKHKPVEVLSVLKEDRDPEVRRSAEHALSLLKQNR